MGLYGILPPSFVKAMLTHKDAIFAATCNETVGQTNAMDEQYHEETTSMVLWLCQHISSHP